MTQFNYTKNIPEQTHNPSVDAPDMKINTNSINDLIGVDHNTFNVVDGGTHNQVQLKNITIPIPIGLQNGFETLYSKAVAGNGEILFTRGNSGVGIQLTGPGTPSAILNGSTFIPGGLIIKWGIQTMLNVTSGTVNFPVAFPNNCFNVQLTLQKNSAITDSNTIGIQNTPSKTSFAWSFSSSANHFNNFYWVAIGN